jgi:hypothetical protein
LKKSGRYDIGEELQYPFTVDREGITAELTAAVREYVHEFKAFDREKTERGVDYEKA